MHEVTIEAWKHRLRARVRDVDPTELGGAVGDSDPDARDVRISTALTPVERHCTLMHELGHIVLGVPPTGVPSVDAAVEDEADEWAASILIPTVVLDHALAVARDLRDVAEHCGVDMRILEARLRVERRKGRVLVLPRPRASCETREAEGA